MTLTVPKEDVAEGYRKVLGEFAANAQMPGFRKGKVPAAVLERKYGEAIRAEALSKLLETAIDDAFDDESLSDDDRPLRYSQPKIEDMPEIVPDTDVTFSMTYDVRPKLTLGQWKGHEIEVPASRIADEDIARELEEIRERNSFVMDMEEGAPARMGDVATVDYERLGDGGEPVETERDLVFPIGSGRLRYPFDGEIVGMVKGGTKEFTLTVPGAPDSLDAPDSEGAPEASGETIRLKVTLTGLKENRLPDLDDELAQDVDEKFKTLDDLKKSVRGRMEAAVEARAREIRLEKLMEKALEASSVVLPDSMVRAEIAGRISAMGRNFGMAPEAAMQMFAGPNGDFARMESVMRPAAETALKSRLVTMALIGEAGIEATDDDLREELEKIASANGSTVETIRERFEAEDAMEIVADNIRERKAHDLLLAENKVKEGGEVAYLDFMGIMG